MPLGFGIREENRVEPSSRKMSMGPVSKAPIGEEPRRHPLGFVKSCAGVGVLATGCVDFNLMTSRPALICAAALPAAKLASANAACLASASDRTWTNAPAAAPARITNTATTAKSACSGQRRLAAGAPLRSREVGETP